MEIERYLKFYDVVENMIIIVSFEIFVFCNVSGLIDFNLVFFELFKIFGVCVVFSVFYFLCLCL